MADPTPTDPMPVAVGAAAAFDRRWGEPWWAQRQSDPASGSFVAGAGDRANVRHRDWVTLGTVARPQRSVVDPRGLITPWPGAWSLDWWVGAEDRWYLPARETTLRQRLVDDAPVVETALRVRGGDVVHRVFAVTGDDGEPWLVTEVANRTAAAVAVAVAVRPWGPTGPATVGSVGVDGRWLVVDGQRSVHLPAEPWRTYVAADGDVPAVSQVLAGSDGAGPAAALTCPQGRAELACVVPLPHTLVLRVAVPLARGDDRRRRRTQPEAANGLPTSVAGSDQVASGWRKLADRGPAVNVPDPAIAAVIPAARSHLLLVPAGEDLAVWPPTDVDYPDHARVLEALAAWGYPDEAADVLGSWEQRQALDGRMLGDDRRRDAAGAAVVALGTHWRLTGDVKLVESQVGVVAKAADWIDRRATSRRHRSDASTLGLLPDGVGPAESGGAPVSYHDAWWSLRGLRDAAVLLAAVDQHDAATGATAAAGRLRAAIDASLATDAHRLGVAAIPAGPGRQLDTGVLSVLDAVLLGMLDPHDPAVSATLDVVRDRYLVHGAVAVGCAGVSVALTARLARVELARGEQSAVDRLRWCATAATTAATWPTLAHPSGGGVAGSGHDPVATAEVLLAVRDLMVRDTGDATLVLAPVVPESWWGQSWEVTAMPTSVGRVGYAVRWHGNRPALLWEVEPADGVTSVRVSAPGLDPAWSADGLGGDALMAALGTTEVTGVGDPGGFT